MLGALAKTFGGRGNGSVLSLEEEVEQLLNRVSESSIPEERTEALSQLRDIAFDSVEAQLALGNIGMPILISILRDERSDTALVRGAIECLHVSMAQAPKARQQEAQATPAHAMNAQLFTTNRENMSLLLSLFDDEDGMAPNGGQPGGASVVQRDFYIRYHAVKTLAALMHATPFRVQEAVANESQRVSQLVSLLHDEEVLRNEGLLLLAAIAANNADLQQLIAFQGAFEYAWQAVEKEGGCEGGGVVQDALDLCCSLTLCNPKTQRMLRELNLIPKLTSLLKPTLAAAAADKLTRQQQLNLLTALMLTQILMAPLVDAPEGPQEGPGTTQRQNVDAVQGVLLKQGLLEPLTITGISKATQGPIRAAALHTATKLIANNTACRDAFASLTITAPIGQIPIIQAVLRVSLYGAEGYGRAAAREVLRSYCVGNREGQLALVSTMVPLGDDADACSSFGSELVKALVSPDMHVSSRAAGVTSLLLQDNADAKQRALIIPLSVHAAPGNYLMPRCMTYVQALLSSQGDRPGLALAAPDILCMLITWTHDCQPAITSLLAAAAHIPCLLDILSGRLGTPHPLTRGLAALLLGVCVLYGTPTDAEGVRGAIGQRVGASEVLGVLGGMQEDPLWVEGGRVPLVDRAREAALNGEAAAPPNPISPAFVRLVNSFQPQLQQALLVAGSLPPTPPLPTAALGGGVTHPPSGGGGGVTHPPSGGGGVGSSSGGGGGVGGGGSGGGGVGGTSEGWPAAAVSTVAALRREIEELRVRNTALAQDLARTTTPTPTPTSSTNPTVSSPSTTATLAAVQARVEDLSSQLSTVTVQRDELQGEVGRLRQQVVGCREEVQLAREAADKFARDLEDLSAAYNQLEAHSLQVEAQLRDAQLRGGGSGRDGGPTGGDTGGVVQHGGGVGLDVDHLLQEARAATRQEVEEEQEESMHDLLVCLGQEEAKAERMRARLEELGEDVDALLEGIGVEPDVDDPSLL